jgi:hypothetical protein
MNMSTLAEMKIPDEIVGAIQASLPSGQIVRHVGLLFGVQLDQLGNPFVGHETLMAVTDNMVAFRQMKWEYDFSEQQLQEKLALESEMKVAAFPQTQTLKFARKFAAKINLEVDENLYQQKIGSLRRYSDQQVVDILTKKYGPINFKWLPEILFSNDVLISDFILKSYAESETAFTVANQMRPRGHQVDRIGYFEFSIHGSAEVLNSFFDDIRRIYDHIRNVKLGVQSSSASVSRVSKCASCGSTELTVQGGYAICDYCQTKFLI